MPLRDVYAGIHAWGSENGLSLITPGLWQTRLAAADALIASRLS